MYSTFLKDLIELSNNHSLVDYNILLTEFDDILLLVELKEIIDDKEKLFNEYQEQELSMAVKFPAAEEYFDNFTIENVVLSDYEYLGFRKEKFTNEPTFSNCSKLYTVLKKLYREDPNSYNSYTIDLNDGYGESGGYCPGEPNYIFTIELNENFYTKEKFKKFLIKDFPATSIPDFYRKSISEYKRLKDSKKLPILQTNTKVRRIGYLKIISDYLFHNTRVPKNKINSRLEDYIIENDKNYFLHANDLKGIIKKTKRGTSAKPYVELSNEIGLINSINRVFISGKVLKVYQVLRKEIETETYENDFHLSKLDKLFFLENLLKNDFFYLSVLLEFIFITENTSYGSINEHFDKMLLNRLTELINQNKYRSDYKIQREFKNIRERIIKWENPRKYLEHILMPRINWFHDLGLIHLNDDNTIFLKKQGITLFNHFCFWNDLNFGRIVSPDIFLDKFYIHVFDDVYVSKSDNSRYHDDIIIEKIEVYLKETFNYFQTLAPNRVTSSQAIMYVIYKAYLVDELSISRQFVIRYLNSNQKTYIYKYQHQYNDGYIQLR